MPSKPAEWHVEEFEFTKINLFVARNATGKTRLLNVIANFAKLLSGELKETMVENKFCASFHQGTESWKYQLHYDAGEVEHEQLFHNGIDMLRRGRGGAGQIETQIVKDDDSTTSSRIKFKAPVRQPAVASKRDDIQHPFLEALAIWGENTRHFQFGSEMDQGKLAVKVTSETIQFNVNEKLTDMPVPIFDKAVKIHGQPYIDMIIGDMKRLGYDVQKIEIKKPALFSPKTLLPGELAGLSVKEGDLNVYTDQPHMSSGMFRALSLICQIGYYQMSNLSGCMIVDDIGEGLDFERSCKLIDIIRDKVNRSPLQLMMSTNNRFVMNRVPLTEWCVLQRKGHHVRIKNYANSKEEFEEFKLTGLNNFDLLATNFLETM